MSATNGTARPRPKSAPPSGGPISITAEPRASIVEIAAGSCARGTTAFSAPASAARKTTDPVPWTNAATGISQNGSASARIAAASVPSASARTASAPSISFRLS